MKHLLATSITIALLSLGLAGCGEKQATKEVTSDAFVTIQGQDLIKPDGTKLFIMGTNLGNWLNPEGYMFKFNKTRVPTPSACLSTTSCLPTRTIWG